MYKTLYLCYFSIRQPLVQTQVLPYLRELKKIDGLSVALLTFEPEMSKTWPEAEIEAKRKKLASEGIEWHLLPYHKRPALIGTFYDIIRGIVFVLGLARREKIHIFHSRGHIPGPIGAVAKMISGGKLLFDIRGFMPEEYSDAGVWKEGGIIFRLVKRLERWLMKKSDGFVVLTEKARDILFAESRETGQDKFGRPVEVIPCCIDGRNFGKAGDMSDGTARNELGITDRKVMTHIGSLGGLYLTDKIVDLYTAARIRDPDSFALILTQIDPGPLSGELNRAGYGVDDFLIRRVSPNDVFRYLVSSDLAISIVKESYSSLSRSPTKVPEYLAAGLPIIASPGVGDLDALIEDENVGVLLKGFSEEDYRLALDEVEVLLNEKGIRQRCRETAFKYFDLETVGGPRYRRIYTKMLAG